MAELPLPKFTRPKRPELSVDEMLAKGREAAAATGQIITGDVLPPPPVDQPASEPEAPAAAALSPAVGDATTSSPKTEPNPAAPEPSGRRPRRAKATARIREDHERVLWQAQVRPDFLLQIRTLALHRDVSPYDVLEDALGAYLRDNSNKR